MIAVIDYGMGNIRSVAKALETKGANVKITSSGKMIDKASKLVFPGVGSFKEGMDELRKRKLIIPIKDSINKGKLFLGLCLGLQLLFEKSQEAKGEIGLNILEGGVKRFRRNLKLQEGKKIKIPHIGWNQLEFTKYTKTSPLFNGVDDRSFVYFVHSYYADNVDESIVTSTTDYGVPFLSSLKKDNIYATQFHPEKSQKIGLKILENFIKL